MSTIGHTLAAVMRMIAWPDVSAEAREQSAPLPRQVARLFADGQSPTMPEARLRITGQQHGGGEYVTNLTIAHVDAVQSTDLQSTNPASKVEFPMPITAPGMRVHTDEAQAGSAAPSYEGKGPCFLARNMFGHIMDWMGKGMGPVDSVQIEVQFNVGAAAISLNADSRLGGWQKVQVEPTKPTA
jgi:hypothetical protein